MRLIAYVRVSTDDQAQHGHSLGQQPQRIAAWAALNGHSIVRVISDDGVSASIPLGKRPGGCALLRALADGHADGVVAQRIDRLFRSARDGLEFAEEFALRHRVALLTVDGAVDTSTPTGWLMLAMQLVTAQYARLMDVQRATETTRSLREGGRVYGHVPYGCIDTAGRLLRESSTWNIREMIVRWRREGVTLAGSRSPTDVQQVRPLSYRAMRALLFAQRVHSPSGSKYWPLSTLRTLCDTHADLAHLPLADDATTASAPLPAAEVSTS
jgi:site-specific DNA recombinase